MVSKVGVEETHFTLDVLGRYTCNTDVEATEAMDRVDARPFDVIVIGGGSFGPITAENVFFDDQTHSRRVLVLDEGPLVLAEHHQNLPVFGTIGGVGRTPWQSDPKLDFAGLSFMLGGRSIFFGGWSPQLLDDPKHTEMPRGRWPDAVVEQLKQTYFPQAAQQLAVDETNDFIFGPLHEVLRQRLASGIDGGKIAEAIPLDELELRLKVDAAISVAERRLLKLEAPLAVQSKAPRPGFFPFNKFSAAPLIIRCARVAQFEVGELLDDGGSRGDDGKKRYMVVPRVRVTSLETGPGAGGDVRVTRIHGKRLEIADGMTDISIPVHDGSNVVIALGTIESVRLVLNSFTGLPGQAEVGANLMAHLRSNVVIRIPRSSLPRGLPRELQASALLLKGAHPYAGGGGTGYFHLQITAAGLNNLTDDDHVELFMKVPDIDFFEDIIEADDQHVVITVRGIGEMEPGNPASRVEAAGNSDQVRVAIEPSARDLELWDAMDRASDQAAKLFAAGKEFEIRLPGGRWKRVNPTVDLEQELPLTFKDQGRFQGETGPRGRRDRLGTTHHEAGTLRLGSNPSDSVTDENCRLWGVENAYIAGPMLFPTIGSPNPMLTGTAFARRLATHLVETMPHHVPQVTPGFTQMFDGTTLAGWAMSTIDNRSGQETGRDNPGRFIIVDGTLEATPSTGLGLLWYVTPMPTDYILNVQWKRFRHEANSGVLLRFPDPSTKNYRNTAWVASDFGYEVQIDELGAPDGSDRYRTGAIYDEPSQVFALRPARPAGEWNDYEIRVEGNRFTVMLNGIQVTEFVNANPGRGQPSAPGTPTYAGLQIHPGSRMAFRNIEYKAH